MNLTAALHSEFICWGFLLKVFLHKIRNMAFYLMCLNKTITGAQGEYAKATALYVCMYHI